MIVLSAFQFLSWYFLALFNSLSVNAIIELLFEISGFSISSASGGAAEDAGFQVSSSSSLVLGFSLTGATIPAGNYVLTNIEFGGRNLQFWHHLEHQIIKILVLEI